MCIWSPMGAQEQGPKGKNPNFKTLSSLDVEVVQPNHSVYRCIFRSRITVIHAWQVESAYGDLICSLVGGGGGGVGGCLLVRDGLKKIFTIHLL